MKKPMRSTRSYEVGYGKPPKASQFRKGQSGNPRGRTAGQETLIAVFIRAHAWLADLSSGRHASIEDLAAEADLHPKVIRQGLRLAFLPPALTTTAITGEVSVALKQVPKVLPFSWIEQRRLLG